MMPTSSLLVALRDATVAHHRRTEAAIPILDPALDLPGYATVLRRMLDVLAPLERALDRALAGATLAWDDASVGWPVRHKAALLERDLAALAARGVVPGEASAPLDDRWPDDAPSSLGALYVVEGATLGGQIVLRRVAPRLGLAAETGAAFYTGYGPRTGPMWQAFATTVARWEEAHAEEAPAVVAAACRTFDRLTERFTR
ncbi:MAG: biliverdin-producing heme oxygenase [Gemmatimonadaceae bacterium]|jgi:heme oxygenase|nr:biliverdin-producing heme oxygenase [Gemmatimonadaceae bacterium]